MPEEIDADISAKNFRLDELTIVTAAGETIDVRFLLTELNIFEDVYSPTVSASLMLNDAKNELMNGPIFGFDQCVIKFGTIGREPIEMTFEIYKVSDRFLIKERQMSYELLMVSKEKITDLKTRVSKSYKGKLISEIVTDLHEEWLDGADLIVEQTKNTHHFVIPNWHPIRAINWLATIAKSERYRGANFMYWQSHLGFHFESLEYKLEQPPVIKYIQQPANVRDQDITDGSAPREYDFERRAVSEYEVTKQIDVMTNMGSGVYGSELVTHDWNAKKMSVATFDYPESFDEYVHLYPSHYLFSRVRPDERNSPKASLKFHSSGAGPYPYKPEEWIQQRTSQLGQLNNFQVLISVPGDSERVPAEIVELDLPSPEEVIDDLVLDKYLKGKFFVTGVRHKLDQDSYVTRLELVKDSTFEAYP